MLDTLLVPGASVLLGLSTTFGGAVLAATVVDVGTRAPTVDKNMVNNAVDAGRPGGAGEVLVRTADTEEGALAPTSAPREAFRVPTPLANATGKTAIGVVLVHVLVDVVLVVVVGKLPRSKVHALPANVSFIPSLSDQVAFSWLSTPSARYVRRELQRESS